MSIRACAEIGYQIVSETYPAGGSMNEPLNFVAAAPEGMVVVGGGFRYDQGSGIDYSRPTADGSAWEVGLTGPSTQPVTVWAVCLSTDSTSA